MNHLQSCRLFWWQTWVTYSPIRFMVLSLTSQQQKITQISLQRININSLNWWSNCAILKLQKANNSCKRMYDEGLNTYIFVLFTFLTVLDSISRGSNLLKLSILKDDKLKYFCNICSYDHLRSSPCDTLSINTLPIPH